MKNRLIAFCMAIVMLFSPLKVSAADEVVISPADLFAPALEDADLPELEEFGADHGTDEQILPLLASAEALVYLASCLGLTAATALVLKNSGMFSEWSNSLESGFYQFCAKAGIASATAVSWLADVSKGTLDKSSEVYKVFKQWVSGQYKVADSVSLENYEYALGLDSFGITSSNLYKMTSGRYYCGYPYVKLKKSNGVSFFIGYDAGNTGYLYVYAYSLTKSTFSLLVKSGLNDDYAEVSFPWTSSSLAMGIRTVSVTSSDGSGRKLTAYYLPVMYFSVPGVNTADDRYSYLESKFSFIPHSTSSNRDFSDYIRNNVLPYISNSASLSAGQSVFAPANPAILQRWEKTGTLDNIDIQIGNDADAQVVDIPWQNVIDQYGSISAQLDAVQEGLISLDEAIAAVGAQVVDKTTDEVIAGGVETDKPAEDSKPDEGGGSSSKPEQKPAAYALDLTKYFPFCLPFDLYEFFTLLIAEPEAPKFDFQLDLTGVGLQKYTLSIDLKVFDSVASIVRTTELLLFIGSLITATRAMFIRS